MGFEDHHNFSVGDALKASHEEVAAEVDVELGEGEIITLYLFVGGRAKGVLDPIFWKAHPEEGKFVHLFYLGPWMVRP